MGNQQNEYQIKPYPEYPKILVTSDGRLINSRTNAEWYTRLNKDGYIYFQYTLNKKVYSRKVHRAVAECFVPVPDHLNYKTEKLGANTVVVKHLDNNKLNNHYTNLAWGTMAENSSEAHRDKIIPILRGVDHGMCQMTEEQVRQVCEIYFVNEYEGKPPSSNSVARLLNLTFKQVQKIRYKETWKHILKDYVDILPNDYPAREYTQASGNMEQSHTET